MDLAQRRPLGMKRYLIVGNGIAGAMAALRIRERDQEGEIHLFTEEAYPLYYRVRFPEFIAGEVTLKEMTIHSREFYQSRNIFLHLEEPIIEIDQGKRKGISQLGKVYPYDLLLLATGGNPFIPPIKGVEKKGVFTLRKMRDAIELRSFSEQIRKAILVGGGLVGLEVGAALLRRGIKVSVIEHNPRILPRQLDTESSSILQKKMETMGFTFFLNGQSEEILGEERVEGVRLKDGRIIEGQMVLLSAGVKPNLQLARQMGLKTNMGIVVNDRMETEREGVFAAGDVAEHRGRCYGIWPAAQKQGEIAGRNMTGGNELYEGTVVSNTLKVVGIDLTTSGEVDTEGSLECMVQKDPENCIYRKVTFKDGRIAGCILLGDLRGKRKILEAIERQLDVESCKETILTEDFESIE